MPFFDFECNKCGKVVTHLMKWAKDMEKHIDKCECGKNDFKKIITVVASKTSVSDEDRAAYDLIGNGNTNFRNR